LIAEVALKANAAIAPHSNPNLTYFVVIEGGGFVRVGDEQARVAAGEAVVWPPDVVHAAWTEHTPMRAIVVEFAAASAELDPILIAGPEPASRAEQSSGSAPAPEPASAAAPAPGREDPTGPSLEPGTGSGLASGMATPLAPTAPIGRDSPEQEPW
jgi:hypothetical protein